MIGYFSSFWWSETRQAYVVCHKQPKVVPPPHHMATGAQIREARQDFYLFNLKGPTSDEPYWSSYPRRDKLGWPDSFLTAGLAKAILAAGHTGMVDALRDAKHHPIKLGPHKWYPEKSDYPTLWDHLEE